MSSRYRPSLIKWTFCLPRCGTTMVVYSASRGRKISKLIKFFAHALANTVLLKIKLLVLTILGSSLSDSIDMGPLQGQHPSCPQCANLNGFDLTNTKTNIQHKFLRIKEHRLKCF